MPTVKVLTTGGTIASRSDDQGKAVAQATGAELLSGVAVADVRVDVVDVFLVGGYLMTLDLMRDLAVAANRTAQEDDVVGLVVTHGTDTLEETALFLDLFLDPDVPVALTGAQRAADAPDSDGPRNLADAILVAAHPASRGRGSMLVFDGQVLPAFGTRKTQTLASTAFAAVGGGVGGWVHNGALHYSGRCDARPRLDLAAFDVARARVDVVACYPGVGATALDAFVAAGARGIVLEAMGAGNANREICHAVEKVFRDGIVVALSTRVPYGAVAAIYGNGGGADLVQAGAVPTGLLRPFQARVLLAALLGVHGDPVTVREELSTHVGG
jgi:L-asparaginase